MRQFPSQLLNSFNSWRLIQLVLLSDSYERYFSSIKRLKTYLRNTTSENRLYGLALLNIHRELIIQLEDVLNQLAIETRKILLL